MGSVEKSGCSKQSRRSCACRLPQRMLQQHYVFRRWMVWWTAVPSCTHAVFISPIIESSIATQKRHKRHVKCNGFALPRSRQWRSRDSDQRSGPHARGVGCRDASEHARSGTSFWLFRPPFRSAPLCSATDGGGTVLVERVLIHTCTSYGSATARLCVYWRGHA